MNNSETTLTASLNVELRKLEKMMIKKNLIRIRRDNHAVVHHKGKGQNKTHLQNGNRQLAAFLFFTTVQDDPKTPAV